MCLYVLQLYCKYHLATDVSSSKTVLHSFHSLELKIAMRPVRSGKDGEGSIHKTIHPMFKSPENPETTFAPCYVKCDKHKTLKKWSKIRLGNASILCASSKTRFWLLIGSNDQTHLIDPNSLSDMNYHDCCDSFLCFWIPVTIIYKHQKHYQQHRHLIKKRTSNTCSPTTFSSCKGWSVLHISVTFKHIQTLARTLLSHRKTVHPLP